MSPRTVFQVLEATTKRYPASIALRQPRTTGGDKTYQTWTWSEYKRAAEEIAAGIYSLGLRKGDVAALHSETRAEFYLADVALLSSGVISAALYPSYPARDSLKTIANCDAKVLFAENPKVFEQLRAASLQYFILLTGEAEGALSLDQLRARGRDAMASDESLLDRVTRSVQPDDLAILYLTSGATGDPKMVMVTQAALVANMEMGPDALQMDENDSTVAFLPSAHIAQRVVVELLPLYMGSTVVFSESLLKLPQEIRSARPTLFLAPPRMWERVYTTVCTEVKKKPAAARKIFYAGLGLGLAAARYRRKQKSVPLYISAPLALADRLVFSKVRARFGGRLRIAASGAAPLGADLAEFYEAIGMPLVEGYGLTEGGVATFNPVGRSKPGSIGQALPGVELKLAQDGELLIRSACLFSGYYKDPAATAEVLRDGWLYTGDIASFDADSYVRITGRKKELIVSSTGKKIFPARIEQFFKLEPLISQVLLVGDRLPYLTALFTINSAIAETLPGMDDWNTKSAGRMLTAPPVIAEVQKIVNRVNKQVAQFEQIRKFRVLGRDFTIEAGELTATMKVRRKQVIENFKEEIDVLYA